MTKLSLPNACSSGDQHVGTTVDRRVYFNMRSQLEVSKYTFSSHGTNHKCFILTLHILSAGCQNDSQI